MNQKPSLNQEPMLFSFHVGSCTQTSQLRNTMKHVVLVRCYSSLVQPEYLEIGTEWNGQTFQVQKALKDVFTASHGDDKRPPMLSLLAKCPNVNQILQEYRMGYNQRFVTQRMLRSFLQFWYVIYCNLYFDFPLSLSLFVKCVHILPFLAFFQLQLTNLWLMFSLSFFFMSFDFTGLPTKIGKSCWKFPSMRRRSPMWPGSPEFADMSSGTSGPGGKRVHETPKVPAVPKKDGVLQWEISDIRKKYVEVERSHHWQMCYKIHPDLRFMLPKWWCPIYVVFFSSSF